MNQRLSSLLWLLLVPVAMMAQSVARQFTVTFPHATDTAYLHVFLPDASVATGRAIVDCPGGGYGHLSMQNEGTDWADFFCSRGITLAVLQYRMPHGDRQIPVSDAEDAIRLLRDSAAIWHLNPRDVGIMGFSAGGHLASVVSTHAEWAVRPDFTILFYPVITMGKKGQHEGSCRNFLGAQRDDEQVIRQYSSHQNVRRHLTPPALILLANDDTGVPPVSNGIAYYEAMRNSGNDCSLYVYPRGGHGFGYRTSFPYHEAMLSDLSSWLSLRTPPRTDAIRVACIGNSITDGSGIDMADAAGYPAQLQRILGSGYEVRNFGVGARTLLNKGDRPYMKELAWRDALAFQPHVVVIKLGTNDSKTDNWKHKEDFESDYQSMIDQLNALPSHPRIILAHPIKAFKDQWTITDSVLTTEVSPAIDRVAKKNGLEVLDLYPVIDDASLMISDGIHPNAKGAGKMAEAVARVIQTERPAAAKRTKKKK